MKPIYPIAAVILVAGLGAWYALSPAAPADETPTPVATVSTVAVRSQSLPRLIDAPGSIIAGTAEQSLALKAAGVLVSYQVVPNEAVQQGQALAQLGPDPVEAANLAKAQDALSAADAARAHVAALLPAHLATKSDLAAATQAQRDAASALAALRATGAGQSYTLKAPAAGLITALPATPGGSLPAGSVLVKFVPQSGLVAQIGLEQSQAAQLQPGDDATLTKLNGGAPVAARVVGIAGGLDAQTGLIDVTLRPAAPVTLGAPVRVQIQAGQLEGVQVPNEAVLRDEKGLYVYQLDAKGIAHRADVELLQQGARTSVLAAKGLNPAWKIATQGAYQLSDGMQTATQGAGS
ncbi:efflux RND transporter periplasmic adaptor subunit [Acidocella facilis]|uniref:efflux RND transporter periplasmic adaptor subunit n=1 Tax=Acidocella facilis TaxID=525 RepID=UPI001F4873D9|nr:efflux RND transporter periplasmic adaptor subunit [Acidocella facilis]